MDPTRVNMLLERLTAYSFVNRVIVAYNKIEHISVTSSGAHNKTRAVYVDSWMSARTLMQIIDECDGDEILISLLGPHWEPEGQGIRALMEATKLTGASLVYSDYRQAISQDLVLDWPTASYQPGSIRDTFDFGAAILLSKKAVFNALRKHGSIPEDIRSNALYDLRLKLSTDCIVARVPESLFTITSMPRLPGEPTAKRFYLQDRSDRSHQLEVEEIATAHLRRIGARIEPGCSPPSATTDEFPVTATVVIATRNRESTIGDAIKSAVNQTACFPYNIVIVDDHSSDATSRIIHQFQQKYTNIIYIIPKRKDLGVGGLWNEAIYSKHCGMYAIQLDSDDVYEHERALEMIVSEFTMNQFDRRALASPQYAMVLGSFTSVNANLERMNSGVCQRLELSRENLRNNLLCVDGASAPRAFYVPVVRKFGFPNISCGEDYATALRIARDYDVGRVFDSIYLARRWEGNTTKTLPCGSIKGFNIDELVPAAVEEAEFWTRMRSITLPLRNISSVQYNVYKDYLRTMEVRARQQSTTPSIKAKQVLAQTIV